MSMARPSTLATLSQAIAKDTAEVEAYLRDADLPLPTFEAGGPGDIRIPPGSSAFSAYERVLDNTRELHLLMLGSNALRQFAHLDVMAIEAVCKLKIAQYIPVQGSASFDELGDFTKIDTSVVRRLLQFAMTNKIFREEPPGIVRHTTLSRLLAENTHVQGALSMLVNESFPAAPFTIASVIRNGGAAEPLQSGWALANHAQAPFYEELNTNSTLRDRAGPVTAAMEMLARATPVDQLLYSYPWAELGAATVVDIGGGRGPVSIALATEFVELRCIVQDLEDVVKEVTVDTALADRVSFMPHNFFDEQPVKNADVYFFRHIFHNWPEADGIKILRAILPALKVGSKIVINEFGLPAKGEVSEWAHKFHRTVDLNMMIYFNGQARELWQWEGFLEKVHPQLRVQKAYHPKFPREERLNYGMVIVEAVLTE